MPGFKHCSNTAIDPRVIAADCFVSADTATSRADVGAYLGSGRRPLVDVAPTPKATTDGALVTDSAMTKQLNCHGCVLQLCTFHVFYCGESSKDLQIMCRSVRAHLGDMMIDCNRVSHLCRLNESRIYMTMT